MLNQQKINFNSFDSLKSVSAIVNDANEALNDPSRTLDDSPLAETLKKSMEVAKGLLIFTTLGPITGSLLLRHKHKQLQQEKERLLMEALEKQHAITVALKREIDATQKRADYLNSLNIYLQQTIKDLKSDLEIEVA